MDIASIIETDSAPYELLHPVDRTPIGVRFIIAGPEHQARRDLDQQVQRRMRRRFAKVGEIQFDDPDEAREHLTEYLVGCTLGWSGLSIDGAPVAYSPERARTLYQDSRYAWIRRQIRAALDAQENFITSSSPASSPISGTSSN